MKKLLCCILAVVVCIGILAGCDDAEGAAKETRIESLAGVCYAVPSNWKLSEDLSDSIIATLIYKIDSSTDLVVVKNSSTVRDQDDDCIKMKNDTENFRNFEDLGTETIAGRTARHIYVERPELFSLEYYIFNYSGGGVWSICIRKHPGSKFDSNDPKIKQILDSIQPGSALKGAASSNSSEASSNVTSPSSSQTTSSKAPAAKTYKAGMYKVGSDLPAGEYLLKSTNSGYMSVASDSSGTLDSIITNEVFDNTLYVTVSEGQYLTVERATFVAADEAPAQQPANGKYSEGMYKVGKDIAPGEYKVHSDEMGYLAVLTNSVGDLDSIVTNDNFEGDKYITLQDGQYLKLSRAYLIA